MCRSSTSTRIIPICTTAIPIFRATVTPGLGEGEIHAEECRDRRRADGVSVLRRRRLLALGRSVRGGRHRFDLQTDRLVSPAPFLECMSVMAALAGRTKRIKFGVNVLSLAMRDAVLVARQCATIDFLSNGRLLPAFGIGSPLGPEWKTLNLDTKTRGRKTDEGPEVT